MDPQRAVFAEAADQLRADLVRFGKLPLHKAVEVIHRAPGAEARLARLRGGFPAFLKLFPDMFRVSKGIVHPIGAPPPEHEELDLGPGLWTPIGLPRHWPPPMQALRTSRTEPWAPLRTMPTEPHELHRDVANAGSLIRPDPLTEPLDSQSEPSPSSPPSALNHAASSVSGVSVSWQPSEDPWLDLARRDAESRGIELPPFQMQRLATTLRERFGYDLAEATHELEV